MGERIVVFEDDAANFEILRRRLADLIGDEFSIDVYDGSRSHPSNHAVVDEWVRTSLLQSPAATLAVLDWDLTAFRHFAPQQLVRGIAEDLAIPLVMYQGANPKDQALEKLRRWQEKRIAIEGFADHEAVAEKCADVARGFRDIRSAVTGLQEAPRLLDTLKNVLKPPHSYPLHLEAFAVGIQEVLSVVGRGFDVGQQRFISTWMGYLIHNRILQFPGPILSRIATASYLGLALGEFDAKDVQSLLDKAVYTGPFARSLRGWWRHEIDNLLSALATDADHQIPIGAVALSRKLERKLERGQCIEKHVLEEPGFLCVLKDAAVCEEHSQAPDAWIPRGADRCRISNAQLDLLQAYLGV